jgi:hypothetical protein
LRFVLPKYAASASAAECEAVTTIARLLMKFAGMYPQRA